MSSFVSTLSRCSKRLIVQCYLNTEGDSKTKMCAASFRTCRLQAKVEGNCQTTIAEVDGKKIPVSARCRPSKQSAAVECVDSDHSRDECRLTEKCSGQAVLEVGCGVELRRLDRRQI